MERFINKEVIILKDNDRGTIQSISKDNGGEIAIQTPSRVRKYNFSVIENEKVVFVDPELQSLAVPFFKELKEYLDELEMAESKAEAERYENEHYAKLRRKTGDSNVMFKCNYCDGGCSASSLGYKGPCSPELREYNVNNRTWCGTISCRCRNLLDGVISQKEFDEKAYIEEKMQFLCYESRMLKDWVAYAGMEEKTGKPMSLVKAEVGSLALLTTRQVINSVEVPEEDRIIFGVFLIAKHEENSEIGGKVAAHPKYRIELTPDEAKKMLVWKYHANQENKDKAIWGTGLHRYLSDMECCQILKDMVDIIQDPDKKALAKELFEKFKSEAHIDIVTKPDGALS